MMAIAAAVICVIGLGFMIKHFINPKPSQITASNNLSADSAGGNDCIPTTVPGILQSTPKAVSATAIAVIKNPTDTQAGSISGNLPQVTPMTAPTTQTLIAPAPQVTPMTAPATQTSIAPDPQVTIAPTPQPTPVPTPEPPKIVTNGVNLVGNCSFESALFGWSRTSATLKGTMNAVTSEKVSGIYSLELVQYPNEYIHVYYKVTKDQIALGDKYLFSAYAKAKNNNGAGIMLAALCYRNDGTYVSYTSNPLSGTTDWTYLSTVVTIPNNINRADLHLCNYGISGTAYFDDVKFEKIIN